MESAERAVVGKIVRPHGVKGDVLVWPTGDDEDRFAPGQVLLAVGGAAAEADGRPDAALWPFRALGSTSRSTLLRGSRSGQ